MKNKKISLSVFLFLMIFILNSTKVSAIVARNVYDPVSIFLYNIMKFSPIVLILAYIICAIIYYKKSEMDKKYKQIRLVILLIIIAIIATLLFCCADIVLEAGSVYTSIPINNPIN